MGIAANKGIGRAWGVVIAAVLALTTQEGAARAASAEVIELTQLQRAALRLAEADAATLRSLRLRVRLSALLPDLRVSWGYGAQWGYATGTVATLDGDRTSYSVGAQWNLSKLVFSSREDLALHHEAQHAPAVRSELVAQVAALYLKRCALAERLAQSTGTPAASAPTLVLRLAQLDASLEALTGRSHPPRACPAHVDRREVPDAPAPRTRTAPPPLSDDLGMEPRVRSESDEEPAALRE